MELVATDTVDGMFEHMDVRRDVASYLVLNRAHGGPEAFARRVRDAEVLLADFDGTLHPGSQWADLKAYMPPELAAEDRAQAEAFFRRERPTLRDELALLFDAVRRMRAAGMTQQTIRKAAYSASIPRRGTRELFSSFVRNPLIVSFGIKPYIAEWCRANGLSCDVAALSFQFFGPPGKEEIADVDWHTAVVGSNKGFVADAYCTHLRVDPSRALALGDSPVDLSMMRPGNIGVLVVPRKDEDRVRDRYRRDGLARMWPSISAVLVSDSLEPLVELRRKQ